jgi:ABC-type nickel/cobalt efflux system permease component RcnA
VIVSTLSAYIAVKGDMIARAALIAVVLVLIGAGSADAHPLGNFSVNHLSTVSITADRVDVRYVLDQAEIPTVQERGLSRAEVLRRKLAEVERGLHLTVDGRPMVLRPAGRPALTFPPGAGGLATTRVELAFNAVVRKPLRVALNDDTFPGRVGWKAIVAAPGDGTAVRTQTPSGDPTGGLRTYPQGLLDTPADRREANFSVTAGAGTLVAPEEDGGKPRAVSVADAEGGGRAGGAAGGGTGATSNGAESASRSDGFTALFADAAAGRGVLIVMLLAALGWGALHALSPGHGKAMVAAYLIGTRGTSRDAVLLGMTVTVTHTIGVFALGLVTLALSQYILPEQLYPWLTLVSGLMVVAVGGAVLRSRLRRRSGEAHGHAHDHGDAHGHAHEHRHEHGPAHSHVPDRRLGTAGLLSMGAAAGLLPCPSALVVLLAAISQHEVALGMLLILAFSLGLAGTLTALGIAVVHARRFLPRRVVTSRVAALLPALSAVLVIAIGLVLAARAVPGVV